MSVHFWGENPAGMWQFEVENGADTGDLHILTSDFFLDCVSIVTDNVIGS